MHEIKQTMGKECLENMLQNRTAGPPMQIGNCPCEMPFLLTKLHIATLTLTF
jgi:hypothetical protein